VSTKAKSKPAPGVGKREDGTLYALPGRAIPGRAEWLAEQMGQPGFYFYPSFNTFLDDQADGETVEIEIASGLSEPDIKSHSVRIRIQEVENASTFNFTMTHAGMTKLRVACAKAVEFFETGGLIGGPVASTTTKRSPARRATKKGGAA
jgi:hypothetical protein